MDGSLTDLSKYRLARAKEDLQTAESNFQEKSYRASVNRSYYAIFHALRAITALDQFDSSKHSGIIAYINQHYVKTGIMDKSFSKIVDKAFRYREKADYEDFFVVVIEDAKDQLDKAEQLIQVVEDYVKTRW